ncbi:hypothetical protein [uncultured Maritimibacter sp.]|uniref:hypothetical protein n=1 Tax=uncultured Maritimibacter sp. TaxID=991866 RepID=UPI002596B9B0|nr:hypothetical protein [uncultured Maritimibacter sp.]
MRTGVTRATLREEIEIEAGFSLETGHGAFSADKINQMIARTERLMARMKDWAAVKAEETVTVTAATQYHNMPSTLTFENIDTVHVSYGDEWLPVEYGIRAEHRSIYDTSQRALPAQRWEVVSPGTTQFEAWPIGNVNQSFLFSGSKTVGTYTDDESTCTLDGDALVMRVAAQILGRDRKEDAQLLLQQADELENMLIKQQSVLKQEEVKMGGLRPKRQLRPGIDFIPSGFS